MRHTRRGFLCKLAASGLLAAGGHALPRAARAAAYVAMVEALRQGVRGERRAHTRCRVFGQDAADEDYRGIAYMFGAG